MAAFENSMQTLLTGLYRDLAELEAQMLDASNLNLSISEMHMLEAVQNAGSEGSATISELSDYMAISLPSVTLAINKLAKKGYVTRKKSENDGRVVHVELTRLGVKAERSHRYFHRSMVREIGKQLTEAEKDILMDGVGKLDAFLKSNIEKYRNKNK